MTTTATNTISASWADVLHRLACGESVDNFELGRLPGIVAGAVVVPHERRVFESRDLAELWAFAAALAAPIDPDGAAWGWAMARAYSEGDVKVCYLNPKLSPDCRQKAWGLGASCDLVMRLAALENEI